MTLWKFGTEFVQPIGKITNLSALKEVWNIIKSHKCSASIFYIQI